MQATRANKKNRKCEQKKIETKSFHKGTMHEQHSDHVSRPKIPIDPSCDILVEFILDNQIIAGIWNDAPDALFNLLQHPSLIHTSVPKCPFSWNIVSRFVRSGH